MGATEAWLLRHLPQLVGEALPALCQRVLAVKLLVIVDCQYRARDVLQRIDRVTDQMFSIIKVSPVWEVIIVVFQNLSQWPCFARQSRSLNSLEIAAQLILQLLRQGIIQPA